MKLTKDSREFIALLNSAATEYVVIGAYAVAYYGRPRYTGDIDIFVRASPENARRLCQVIAAFGMDNLGIVEADFLEARNVVQLGVAPNRIDILTEIDGVDFSDAWKARVEAEHEGTLLPFISREHLIQNKRATGRPQDLADLQALGEEI